MNVGLVLSGGMAKGAYQVGALKALENFVPSEEIKFMSCASIGVLNGYSYITHKLKDAEHMWKNICPSETRILISKILRSSLLQQHIKNLYDKNTNIEIPFYCSLLDFGNFNLVYKDLSCVSKFQLLDYLKASVAMPIYNRAVKIDSKFYFDGAMIDNIPVYPLLKHNLDYLICMYFDDVSYRFESSYFDNKVIKITFPSNNLLKQSIVFKNDSIDEMIQSGYDRTMFLLKSVFADGYDNLKSIYETIGYLNQTSSESLRITGDVLVTNLNKIAQRLTKRKIL